MSIEEEYTASMRVQLTTLGTQAAMDFNQTRDVDWAQQQSAGFPAGNGAK